MIVLFKPSKLYITNTHIQRVMNKEQQLKCPNCNGSDIIRKETYSAMVTDQYAIDYDGNTHVCLDQSIDDESDTDVTFECQNCYEYSYNLNKFKGIDDDE